MKMELLSCGSDVSDASRETASPSAPSSAAPSAFTFATLQPGRRHQAPPLPTTPPHRHKHTHTIQSHIVDKNTQYVLRKIMLKEELSLKPLAMITRNINRHNNPIAKIRTKRHYKSKSLYIHLSDPQISQSGSH